MSWLLIGIGGVVSVLIRFLLPQLKDHRESISSGNDETPLVHYNGLQEKLITELKWELLRIKDSLTA